jgi:dihydrofolate synthase/folylpolyglutamate synthase
MTYRQCLNYLFDLQKFGIKLGLVNTARLLNYLGNPHFKYPTVHIAGTNGKGSVCAMLEAIISSAGYRTGLYTSPHLVSFTERVRIGRKEVEPEFITEFVNQLKPRIERDEYTFFEVTTALAFLYFAWEKVDLAVIETGLGGRLDATNLVQPEVVGITNISLEHTDILGRTLRKIAYEKGGIIKTGVPTVIGPVDGVVKKTLAEICRKRNSKNRFVLDTSQWEIEKLALEGSKFSAKVEGKKYSNLQLNLAGRYQVLNATFALNIIEELKKKGWRLPDGVVRRGLQSIFWPARFQTWRRKPLVILDAAHNPSGVQTLIRAFQDLLPGKKVNFLFGVMGDKDYSQMLRLIAQIAGKATLVSPKIERAAEIAQLIEIADKLGLKYSTAASVKSGFGQMLKECGKNEVLCVTGSHYVIGELLS